jgi:predicted aspartyl protease
VALALQVLALLPACSSVSLSPSPEAITGPLDGPVPVPLDPYVGRLKQVDVLIGDRSYPFLFDTGGGLTLISPEVAAAVGCRPYGRLTGYRMSGEQVHFEQCGEVSMRVGGVTLTPGVGVFDLMALLPEGLPPLHGVLSLHTFQDHPITLDLRAGELTVETPRSVRGRVAEMEPVRVSVEREVEGRAVAAYVVAEAERGELLLLLDSGNLRGVLLAPHAVEQLGLPQPPEGQRQRLELRFPELGAFEVEAEVAPLRHDGAVGAEFMEGVVLVLDVASGHMWAQRK